MHETILRYTGQGISWTSGDCDEEEDISKAHNTQNVNVTVIINASMRAQC
jgi:hypothetical protein